ncbi:MAG: VOC family protein [Acidobacteria bacterium]|nr:VOC family protein [Acidobacteriota bacterium]
MTHPAWLDSAAVFDHVGMAVRSIRDLADENTAVIEDPVQRVSVAFVDWGGVRIELIEPLGSASPIDNSLTKGQVLVHLCFRVPDLDRALSQARRAGLVQLARPVPAPAFDGRRIAWLFSRAAGLIELVEGASHV